MGFFSSIAKPFEQAAKSVANTATNFVKNPINTARSLVDNPFLNPVGAVTSAVTGMPFDKQLEIGAMGGAAISGLGALGLFGGGAGAAGAAGAGGAGGASGLSMLSNFGGIPTIVKIALGASVASEVASLFGKNPGDDYQNWLNQQSAADQAQVQQLTDNLNKLQSDLDTRNAAVKQLVDNYPNIVDQAISDIQSSGLSKSMDDMDRLSLDRASTQLAAKYAAQGGFSSGSFNQGLAQTATDLAINRGQTKIDLANQIATQKLTDANALRAFSQRMLSQGVDQRFSAAQSALSNADQGARTLAQINANDTIARRNSLSSLAGNTANLAVNLAGFSKMSGASGGSSTPLPGFGQLPGGGTPLPDFSDIG